MVLWYSSVIDNTSTLKEIYLHMHSFYHKQISCSKSHRENATSLKQPKNLLCQKMIEEQIPYNALKDINMAFPITQISPW